MYHYGFWAFLTLLFTITPMANAQTVPDRIAATSPNGQLRIEFLLTDDHPNGFSPRYQVRYQDQPVVLPSRLGLVAYQSPSFGRNSSVEKVQVRSIDETYLQSPGKRKKVVNRCEEIIITLSEHVHPALKWELILRAYDDGVALRYRILTSDSLEKIAISRELTEFRLPKTVSAYTLPLDSYRTSHEARYQHTPISKIADHQLLGLPLLGELPGVGWIGIAEAALFDYAGMYLAHNAVDKNLLNTRLSPLPSDPEIAVQGVLPLESPWRVILFGERLTHLVDSDIILNLNPPCALGDTSWIKTGKTTFPWWNGYFEEESPFELGLDTATAKYYIDFCAEAGIPYHSLDGKGNAAWYGGPIVPYQNADITRGVDGLDLQEVLSYAESKGVKIRLWLNWKAAEVHMEQAFPLYHAWGVEGVMLDFMDRDDQTMIQFLQKAIKTAAANELTVTLHGVSAPTGLERTYPNLLSHEGVLNLEYDKWDPRGITPEHELVVPFTRMLAGPLDFHQGSLRGVSLDEFRPRNEAPLVIGTPCRMLASYVVYQNHLPMVADYPSSYRGHPLLPVLAAVPTTWDDTRCLAGIPEKLVVLARRHGHDWWVGVMVGRDEQEVQIPLSFLGPGPFVASLYRDDPDTPEQHVQELREVTSTDLLSIPVTSGGGLLIHFQTVFTPTESIKD